VLELLDGWVHQTTPASVLYQPYISEAGERGPFIDTNARAGFTGLCTRHGIADMARAIFEGLGLAARDCYLAMGSLPGEISLSGGAAKSKQLVDIIAACVNSKIQTSTRDEAGAAGAAMMAMVGTGHYASMNECLTDWVDPLMGDVVSPITELAATYQSLYPAYVEAQRGMRPVWQLLSERPAAGTQTMDG
jgi:erythritol kinase